MNLADSAAAEIVPELESTPEVRAASENPIQVQEKLGKVKQNNAFLLSGKVRKCKWFWDFPHHQRSF